MDEKRESSRGRSSTWRGSYATTRQPPSNRRIYRHTMHVIDVRLPPDWVAALDSLCESTGETRSDWLRWWIECGLRAEEVFPAPPPTRRPPRRVVVEPSVEWCDETGRVTLHVDGLDPLTWGYVEVDGSVSQESVSKSVSWIRDRLRNGPVDALKSPRWALFLDSK